MYMKFDEADRIILDLLQTNAAVPINDIVFASGLSVASVQRRLKKLRDAKIIDREIAVINPALVGQKMTIIVMVELERERVDQLEAFKKMAKREPHVQQCYYVTGEADFVLICIVPDMDEFEALTRRLFFENTNVRRFRTNIVMNRTKVGLSVPLWPQES